MNTHSRGDSARAHELTTLDMALRAARHRPDKSVATAEVPPQLARQIDQHMVSFSARLAAVIVSGGSKTRDSREERRSASRGYDTQAYAASGLGGPRACCLLNSYTRTVCTPVA